MDKVRKIAARLWYNKERMVLAIMVALLCWNVYKVMYPPPPAKQTDYTLPKGEVTDVDLPTPPKPFVPRMPQQWDVAFTPNPFWYFSGQKAEGGGDKERQDAGISLLRIKQVGDTWRAQLKTTRTAWYDEGEQFESFELLKIHPDEGTCEVNSQQLGRVIVLRLPGK